MGVEQGDAVLGVPETEATQSETGKVIRYDCGWLGCDEMPMVTRRVFQSVEVGDVVEFLVREPSSKEDTPPFCRMLGHRILATDQLEDGVLLIRVQRAR